MYTEQEVYDMYVKLRRDFKSLHKKYPHNPRYSKKKKPTRLDAIRAVRFQKFCATYAADGSPESASSFDSKDEQLEISDNESTENLQQQPVSSLASQGSQKPIQEPLVIPVRCATAGKQSLHKPNAGRIKSFLSNVPENFSNIMQQMDENDKKMKQIRTERALKRQGQSVLTQFFSPAHS